MCRVCGYNLQHLDWSRAAYRCPECGEVNIPGDHRVSPIQRRPPASIAGALLLMLWPGLATGLALGALTSLDSDWSTVLVVFTGLFGAVVCLTWPAAGAELLLHRRVPERVRSRILPWLLLGGMVANIILAVTIARGLYVLAR